MILSIIVPCYNENSRGVGTELSFLNRLIKLRHALVPLDDYELILVDDCSKDDSVLVFTEFVQKNNLDNWFCLQINPNGGKGNAIKQGILTAKGDYILFMDADLSVSPDYIRLFLDKVDDNTCVIGTRYAKNSVIVNKRSLLRRIISVVARQVITKSFGFDVTDTQCGFKAFSREKFLKVARYVKGSRWAFDIEIMYCLKLLGVRFEEIPVTWINMEQESTLKVGKALKCSITDYLRLLCRQRVLKEALLRL